MRHQAGEQTEGKFWVDQNWWRKVLAVLWGIWAIALLAVYYRQILYTFGPRLEPLPEPGILFKAQIAIPGISLLFLLAQLPMGQFFLERRSRSRWGWVFLFAGALLSVLIAAGSVTVTFPYLGEALLRALQGVAGAVCVVIAAQILGLGLVKLLHWNFDNRYEALLYQISLGLGSLAYLSMGLAGVGLYYSPNVQLLIGAILMAGGVGVWYKHRRNRMEGIQNSLPPIAFSQNRHFSEERRRHRLWQAITCLALFIALIGALAPEHEYDALWYHIGLPKVWLAHGTLVDLRNDYVSLYPMTWELIFGAGLAMGGAIASKLLHFATLPLTGLLVFLMTRRFVPQASPWLAVALFVTIPMVVWQATTTYIDLALALHVGLVIYALLRYREHRYWQWLILAALNLGLALATKHLALFVLALATLGLFLHLWQHEHRLQQVLPPVLVFIGLSLLLPLPWYIRSWLGSGNPVFPELFEIFGAPPDRWNEITERGLSVFLSRFGRPRTFFNLLTLPWDMTTHAARYGGTLGPLLLLLLPPLVLWRRWSSATPWILGFVGLYLVLWASPISSYQMRFLVPIAPLLAVLAAEATAILADVLKSISRYGAVVLYVGLAVLLPLNLPPFTAFHEGDRVGWNGWLTHVIRDVPFSVVLGKESQEQYLQRQVSSYSAWKYINASLPEDAYILTFSGGDHFYSDRQRLWGYAVVAHPATWGAGSSAEKAFQHLSQLGITHILLDKQGLPALVSEGVAIAQPATIAQHYLMEYEDRSFVLYRIRY